MSSSPESPPPTSGLPLDPASIPKFDNTLGALLLAGLAASALWGITCTQTFSYFTHHGLNDKKVLKTLIGVLWVLDTFDTSLNCHILYHYLISNFMNPLAIAVPVWSVVTHVAITSICNFIIRGMFARRIYHLSKRNVVVTFGILALSLTELVVGLVITVKAFKLGTFARLESIKSLFYLDFVAGTTSDIMLALTLCYLLRRSRTGITKTDSLIRVLIAYTVYTGSIVAVDATLGMVLYIAMPDNFIFIGLYLLLGKLYINSYLASLNARESLRNKANEPKSINLTDLTPRFNTFSTTDAPSGLETTIEQKASGVSSNSLTLKRRSIDHIGTQLSGDEECATPTTPIKDPSEGAPY